MSPQPTGRIFRTAAGRDLELVRTFRAPIEDVWASITEPERTARWFGPWSGRPGAGSTIRYSMVFEQGSPEAEMTIRTCDAPHHLELYAEDSHGIWHIEARLTEHAGITELRFTQHLAAQQSAGDIGPGWEYYLDNLVASRDGAALPSFADYYPSQKAYFLAQEAEVAPAH